MKKEGNDLQDTIPFPVGDIIFADIKGDDVWEEVKVLGYGKHGEDLCIMFCQMEDGEESELHAQIYTHYEPYFSAVPKERDVVVEDISTHLVQQWVDSPLNLQEYIKSLYEKGYLNSYAILNDFTKEEY